MYGKTHKTAVVIIPPQELWPCIQAIRRKHDRQARRWMPHINLLYPFLPPERFDWILERLAAACAELSPFEIELAEFRRFVHKQGSATVWLAPEPAERVVELHEALWRAAPMCDDVRLHPDGYTPHLSVGQAPAKDRARRLIQELQAGWTPLRFLVSAIHVIARDDPPRDRFKIVRSLPPRGAPASVGDCAAHAAPTA